MFPAGWQSYQVAFDPTWSDATAMANGWAQEPTSAPWQTLWTDVYTAEVRISLSDEASAIAHIDNFALTPAPVPEPGTIALLGVGLVAGALALRRKKA